MRTVTALRSRRLETLLGAQLDAVTYQQVSAIVTNQVPEAFDLDFKQALYGNADRDRRELATDVAALANTAGGLIILGIQEDDRARAGRVTPVAISDAETARMHQILASLTAPLPVFGIVPVERPTSPGMGFYLVAVPRSARQPHAVIVNEGLRYPRSNGSTTRNLAEAEVATAYRDRFLSVGVQTDRAVEAERDLLIRLAVDRLPWVVVSLVPDVPGDMAIDAAVRRDFRTEMIGTDPLIVHAGVEWQRIAVGRRRLIADGTMGQDARANWVAAELHSDGAGAFAVVIPNLNEGRAGRSDTERLVEDESIVMGVISGLRLLARHARDRTAAGGGALARAQLYPASAEVPLRLGHSRGLINMGGSLGDQILASPMHPAEQLAPLDDLADDGPGLLATVARLVGELFQAFGYPEITQITRDGRLRRRYWLAQRWPALEAWAKTAGVEISEEQVDLS